jgi:hypothetical protein
MFSGCCWFEPLFEFALKWWVLLSSNTSSAGTAYVFSRVGGFIVVRPMF